MEPTKPNSIRQESSHPGLYNQDPLAKLHLKGSTMHKTTEYQKSPATLARIQAITLEIKQLEKGLRGIKYSLSNFIYMKKTPYAPRTIRFSRLPRSEKTFHETIDNIKKQIALLKRELETLIIFGA